MWKLVAPIGNQKGSGHCGHVQTFWPSSRLSSLHKMCSRSSLFTWTRTNVGPSIIVGTLWFRTETTAGAAGRKHIKAFKPWNFTFLVFFESPGDSAWQWLGTICIAHEFEVEAEEHDGHTEHHPALNGNMVLVAFGLLVIFGILVLGMPENDVRNAVFHHNWKERDIAHQHVPVQPCVVADGRRSLYNVVLVGHGCQHQGQTSWQAILNFLYRYDKGASTQKNNGEHWHDDVGDIVPWVPPHLQGHMQNLSHHFNVLFVWSSLLWNSTDFRFFHLFHILHMVHVSGPNDQLFRKVPSSLQAREILVPDKGCSVPMTVSHKPHLIFARLLGVPDHDGYREVLAIKRKVVQLPCFRELARQPGRSFWGPAKSNIEQYTQQLSWGNTMWEYL